MCAAKKDYKTFGRFYGEGRIISKRISHPRVARLGTHDKMRVACFQCYSSGYFTAEINSGGQLGKVFDEVEFCAGCFKFVPAERQADISLFMLPFPESFSEYLRVGIDTTRPSRAKQGQEPSAMIIMSMAEDDSVKVLVVKAEG